MADHPQTGGSFSKLTTEDVMQGTKVIASYVLDGKNAVPIEEATKRAALCITCPKQVDTDVGCGACKQLYRVAKGLVGRKTVHDGNLHVCAVCRCHNAAQIHVPAEFLAKGVKAEMMEQPENQESQTERRFPVWCWKRQEVEPFMESGQ